MADYFKLWLDDETRWHLELLAETPPVDIWACERVTLPSPIRFGIQMPGVSMDFNPSCFAIPVVSKRLAELMESIAPYEVQRLPAIIEGDPADWEVLNVVSKVNCIDHERSCIQYYPKNHPEKPGKPRGVVSLVLDTNRANGHHVFRATDWEVALIVSEHVKTALEELGATGIEYVPASD